LGDPVKKNEIGRVLVGKPERKRPLEDLRVDGSIILKWISKNRMGRHGVDCTGSG
jgi:hypothetical protein